MKTKTNNRNLKKGSDNIINNKTEDNNVFDGVIHLKDVSGQIIEFQFLGAVSYRRHLYYILIPGEIGITPQYYIYRVGNESDTEAEEVEYILENDPKILRKVFRLYKIDSALEKLF